MPNDAPQESTAADDAIRERVAQLVKSHSQAEVARRTGASKSNVNRYLHGGKIPAEFCAALANGLGVNPAWLLSGEGVPMLADVNTGTARTASNVLELVQAMSAVTRMRLGALAGKQHARVLRQLNDTLTDYERLKGVLHEKSEPVLRKVIEDLESALDAKDNDRAVALRAAAVQLARLCDNAQLHHWLDNCQGRLEIRLGNFVASLEFQRKLFYGVLARSPKPWADIPVIASQYASGLHGFGYLDEARRIAYGALEMTGDEQRTDAGYRSIEVLAALLDIELGDLRTAMSRLERMVAAGELAEGRVPILGAVLTIAQVLSGCLSPESAVAMVERYPSQAEWLLVMVSWTENTTLARRALKEWAGSGPGQYREDQAELINPTLPLRRMIRLLDEHDETVLDEMLSINESRRRETHRYGPMDVFLSYIGVASIAQILGRREMALEYLHAGWGILVKHRPDVQPGVLALAKFYRTALRLLTGAHTAKLKDKDRQLVDEARAFFISHDERGYGLFHDIAQSLRGAGAVGDAARSPSDSAMLRSGASPDGQQGMTTQTLRDLHAGSGAQGSQASGGKPAKTAGKKRKRAESPKGS